MLTRRKRPRLVLAAAIILLAMVANDASLIASYGMTTDNIVIVIATLALAVAVANTWRHVRRHDD